MTLNGVFFSTTQFARYWHKWSLPYLSKLRIIWSITVVWCASATVLSKEPVECHEHVHVIAMIQGEAWHENPISYSCLRKSIGRSSKFEVEASWQEEVNAFFQLITIYLSYVIEDFSSSSKHYTQLQQGCKCPFDGRSTAINVISLLPIYFWARTYCDPRSIISKRYQRFTTYRIEEVDIKIFWAKESQVYGSIIW